MFLRRQVVFDPVKMSRYSKCSFLVLSNGAVLALRFETCPSVITETGRRRKAAGAIFCKFILILPLILLSQVSSINRVLRNLAAQKEQQVVTENSFDKFHMISAHHWQWYHHSASSSSSSSPHSPQHYGPNGPVIVPNGSPTVNVTNCGDVAPSIQQGNVFIVNVTFTNLLTAFTHFECFIEMCYSLVKPISFGVVLLNIFSILLHLFILAKD